MANKQKEVVQPVELPKEVVPAAVESVAVKEPTPINTRELQKFLDTFGPVLSALPAVINATEQAREMERHIVILTERRDAIVADSESRVAALAAAVEKAKTSLSDLEAQRKLLTQDLRDFELQCKAGKKGAEDATDAAVARCQERAAAASLVAAEAEAERDARIKAVDDEVAERLLAGQVEIDAIEERRAVAQKALDELRASLQG